MAVVRGFSRECLGTPLKQPFDVSKRVLYRLTSRVIGSPDPPPPYRTTRAFPQLSFDQSLYLVREPGTNRLLVVLRTGKIVSFLNDPEVRTPDLFCEIKDHETYAIQFHPQYSTNRYVYVFSNGPFSQPRKKNRILRYQVSREDPPAV